MLRYALKRLGFFPFALLVAHFAGFAYAFPGSSVAGGGMPLFPAYFDHLQQILRFGLGTFPGTSEAVAPRLVQALWASLGLLMLALVLSVGIGLVLGLRAARANPPSVARWMTPFSTFGLAMPSFYLGSLLIVGGIYYAIQGGPNADIPLPLQGFGWDAHLVLPLFVLAFRPTVQIAQVTADLLAGELGKQYVTAARSLGHTERRIRWRYALRNTLVPVIVTISNAFRLLIGELILVEYLFAWPGLGRLLVLVLVPTRSFLAGSSYLFAYPPLVAAIVAIFAAWFLLGDLVAGTLIRSFDPRTQGEEGRHG